ncbi:DUF4260 family protein [Hymenobacter crusticola]|uniref:DUF4260 family protein n=1 Tax=Hymenobacter crusticola TaxID=1770526 RepID=UPI001C4FBCC0|nr:DUF4260 family protein [Hymenobacter crusticola]
MLSFHSALDRLLGYGLKYTTGFHDTHLGRVGDHAAAEPMDSVLASSAVQG